MITDEHIEKVFLKYSTTKAGLNFYPCFKNAVHELEQFRNEEVEKLKAELEEQCRLNGMGSERELALMAELNKLKRIYNGTTADTIIALQLELQRLHSIIERAMSLRGYNLETGKRDNLQVSRMILESELHKLLSEAKGDGNGKD